jgi:hypothetical protein
VPIILTRINPICGSFRQALLCCTALASCFVLVSVNAVNDDDDDDDDEEEEDDSSTRLSMSLLHRRLRQICSMNAQNDFSSSSN